jgi:hypothetical protein
MKRHGALRAAVAPISVPRPGSSNDSGRSLLSHAEARVNDDDRLFGKLGTACAWLISADDAQIPSGKYKVTFQISDTKGRVGTQESDFRVA